MFRDKYFHSGSTLLNLALTGKPYFGFPIGKVVNIVGDSSTGKTLLAIVASAFAQNLPPKGYSGVTICFDTAEAGFNKDFATRVGLDLSRVQLEENTRTVEDFIEHFQRFVSSVPPSQAGIYVLDSLDALSSQAELDRAPGEATYGTDRAKAVSEFFRRTIDLLAKYNITLIIISQVRENISSLPFAPKYRRAGGRALDFYSDQIIWLSEVGKIKDGDLVAGINVRAKVTKNRHAPPFREADFQIIFSFGIDDVASLVQYLVKKKQITGQGGWYKAPFLDQERSFRLHDIVQQIEQSPELFSTVVDLVAKEWAKEEEKLSQKVHSKPKLWDLVKRRLPQDDSSS